MNAIPLKIKRYVNVNWTGEGYVVYAETETGELVVSWPKRDGTGNHKWRVIPLPDEFKSDD